MSPILNPICAKGQAPLTYIKMYFKKMFNYLNITNFSDRTAYLHLILAAE